MHVPQKKSHVNMEHLFLMTWSLVCPQCRQSLSTRCPGMGSLPGSFLFAGDAQLLPAGDVGPPVSAHQKPVCYLLRAPSAAGGYYGVVRGSEPL